MDTQPKDLAGHDYGQPPVAAPVRRQRASGWVSKVAAVLIVLGTVVAGIRLTAADSSDSGAAGPSKAEVVLWAAWITAVSTGGGIVPLWAFPAGVSERVMGVCNAVAAGMMVAASGGLVLEAVMAGSALDVSDDWLMRAVQHWTSGAGLSLLMGALAGVAFVHLTKHWLDQHEDVKFAGFTGMDARRIVLLIAVMTAHSFTEGVGIGVAFGGEQGGRLGSFITTTLALHNIPEGLAVCLVLVPQGTSKLDAAVWAVVSSLPQPLMAVPAMLFVDRFASLLPVGLGFAAGAMAFVAVVELWADACAALQTRTATILATVAAAGMAVLQLALRGWHL